jgi:hypothetical protein
MKQVKETGSGGSIQLSDFASENVYLLDSPNHGVFVWVGRGNSKETRSQAMKLAMEYVANQGRAASTPVMRVMQEDENDLFKEELGLVCLDAHGRAHANPHADLITLF